MEVRALRTPDQWFSQGPLGMIELGGCLVLGGVVIAILVLQPLVWKIAFGVMLGELGVAGLIRAFGRYREARPGWKSALTPRVQKQHPA
jgi:hypothetical protein